jgi:hypothetical protein
MDAHWRVAALAGFFVGFGGLVAAEAPRAGDMKADPKALLSRLKPGMAATDVRDLLGPPKQVARQILFSRYVEQWMYDDPVAVRIEFDWRKGQEKQIQTVQPLREPAR